MPQVRSLLANGRNVRPLVSALTIGLALSGCSNASPLTTTSPSTTLTTAVATTRVEAPLLDPSTTTTTILTAESLPPGSSLVGQAASEVEIYEGPELAAPSRVLEAVTILGTPRVFLIKSGPVDGWVEVSLPIRPNGSTGWVRADSLELEVLDYSMFVDLSDRRLRLEQNNEVVLETEIAIGSPTNPTPTGSYFVTDIVQLSDPSGPWGSFALGLSAFSDTITEFNGGDGIIGIHGTNRPASIGQPVSLGCVRVLNEIATRLAELVKLGTPVEIAA